MKIFYFFGKTHIKNEIVENTNTSAEAFFGAQYFWEKIYIEK